MSERWRTVILVILLMLAIGFIWFLKNELSTNFIDTL